MTKHRSTRHIRRFAAATALLIALSGCQSGPGAASKPEGQAPEQPAPRQEQLAERPSGPQTPGSQSPQQSYDTQRPVPPNGGLLPPQNEGGKGQGTGENVRPPEDNVTADIIEEKWNMSVPKLLNLAIGEGIVKASEQFGTAEETYLLADDEEQITVNCYNGFAVGHDKDQQIRFIEVFESGVRTGLNGIRIGDFEEDVLEALGKPTTHTSYVIGYKAKGALLKFDMDPKNREIVSIKLFYQT
ncbi:hypothetical protein [Paenibacillus daejeonensis]|uniref:hypothetical protein n=1 Tax=Paenibacillus daejeonensis TaxID=135193 RepID=UPI00036D498F|nr:hypothetical protein [Paenibacillus daejeonensis]